MIVVWIALQLMLVVASVQLMDRSIWRRSAAVAVLLAAMCLPILLPVGPLPRAILASLALLALIKVLQVARAPESWTPRNRLWHSLVPFDIGATGRVTPQLDRGLLKTVLVFASLAVVALLILFYLPRQLSAGLQLIRLLLGALLAYSGMETVTEGVRLLHALAGVSVPPIQVQPIASLSIREFWSKRWNRPVSGWLNEFVFAPVMKWRGPEFGLLAAFCASAILHGWVFLVSVGWLAGFMVGCFFLFNALFVLIESAIGVRKLSLAKRRAWTLGLLLLSSPLFVEPLLQLLGL